MLVGIRTREPFKFTKRLSEAPNNFRGFFISIKEKHFFMTDLIIIS